MIDVKELRSGERFVLNEPLTGTFGAAEITVLNVAEQGAQVTHAHPLRIASRSRLWFKRGDAVASVHALVVWSRLSKTPDAAGKYLYMSGLRIEDDANAFASTLQTLADHGVLRRDADSLDRKRQTLEEREHQRLAQARVKLVHQEEVPSDQALLVRHAQARLRANPEEALKWYNRARFAVVDEETLVASTIRNREDVLAIWEYLERTVPLSTIARVLGADAVKNR